MQDEIKKSYQDLQTVRKTFHVIVAWFFATLYYFYLTPGQMQVVGGIFFGLVSFYEIIKFYVPEGGSVYRIMTLLLRAHEFDTVSCLFWSAGVFWLMTFVLTPGQFIYVLILMSVADPLSNIIGLKYGSTKLVGRKSLQGGLAFFIGALIVSIVYFNQLGLMGGQLWLMVIGFSLAAAIMETISTQVDDNVTVPILLAIMFWIL